MTIFENETYNPALLPKFGGFNAKTKELQPMNLSALGSPYLSNPRAVLENIAGALEADLITENGWVAELFASPRCLGFFKAQLLMSGDGWMDEKRWSQAMHKLAGCKQKQNGGAMLISKMLERARKAGQVVDHIIKPRSA